MAKTFLRNKWRTYSKLGRRRKKKQKYRKSKGIDNKMRLKMKGNPRNISIGFRKEKIKRELIKGLRPVLVKNIEEIKQLRNTEIGIVAKVGDQKKKEIAEYALKNKAPLLNMKPEKILKTIEEKKKEKERIKEEKTKKKAEKEKKAKKEKEASKKEATKDAAKPEEETKSDDSKEKENSNSGNKEDKTKKD